MTNILSQTWPNTEWARKSMQRVVGPWCKNQWAAGHQVTVELRRYEDAKSDRQRRYLHGYVLMQIAQQAAPNGQYFPMKVWKEYARERFLGYKTVTVTDPMTGVERKVARRVSTEDLGVRAYSDYIDRVTAWAATDLGVTFMTFEEWDGARVDPGTGEILGGDPW